ncbi:MAG: hypothetical protein CMQ46_05665 [Gammaproteobacteria bacterium]|nr:hypothetical protein [Gammaproteobacteria bacterium]MBJ54732.1 hypothetical protein [Gammaproteobacteria bacterium]|tara:strand:+ start:1301 stop:1708 length:408 start_codon:yes stop_codon:yes gene_type:complete
MRVSEEWFKEKFGTLPERGKVFRPERAPKKHKYGAKATGEYASKKEAKRAQDLKAMQKAGMILKLREQVKYELIPSQRGSDGKVVERAVSYTADFVYEDRDGNTIVEDAKGVRTQQYIIRRKLMLWIHGIKVVEV